MIERRRPREKFLESIWALWACGTILAVAVVTCIAGVFFR